MCIAKCNKQRIVQMYAPSTSYSEEDINNFYNDVDATLGETKSHMIVMEDFKFKHLA